jgi:hypothetical protein
LLEFVPEKLRTAEVCLEAVAEDSDTLEFVPDELKERIKAAMKESKE